MAARKRVLIDTNVLVSAAYFGGKPSRLVDLARQGEFVALTSLHILTELREVVARAPFSGRGLDPDEAAIGVADFAEVIPVELSERTFTEDPDDDPVVLAAIVGRADAIVTGDGHLLSLKDPPVRIGTVSDLLAELGEAEPGP
ncbi:MAG: putative toxin-antitoxin system toxin component, PIN family [Coriobacteriales bacterium]|nr:putative toxin-antitoxin system toxin component, PIN family [Coriobacteriales bacterium]